MIYSKLSYGIKNRRSVLFFTIIALGVIGVFIKINPIVLLWLYMIVAITPWIIIFLRRDLTNGLLIWMLLVLFSRAAGQINLPMLPDINFYRILWIILVLAFIVQIALRERDFLPITKIEIMMILFCAICLISMLRAGVLFKEEHGLVLRNFLNGYAIPFSIFFLVKNIVDSEQKIKKIFQFLLIIGIYLTLTGIFEYFRITALVFPRNIMDPNVGIHYGRARGPFTQAAVNGTVLGIIFLLSVYFFLHMHRKRSQIFFGIPIALMPIALFFTYTRACWIGFIFSLLLIAFTYPRLRKIFLFGFFMIVTVILLNWSNLINKERTRGRIMAEGPIYNRINLYAASLKMFLEKPIFGFGFNTFEKESPAYFVKIRGVPFEDLNKVLGAHDTLVSILVELGLIGLVPLLLIFFYFFRHSIKLYQILPSEPFLGKGLIAVFWGIGIIFIVNMQFIQTRYFLFPNSLFFLFAGIVVGLEQRRLLYKNISKENSNTSHLYSS